MEHSPRPAIIGAGPAGLAAAEALGAAGFAADIYDAMPSPARKFLRAGIGGLNITHSEPFADFLSRYGGRADKLQAHLRAFGPQHIRDWAAGLGVETFVGSSGRVFPKDFKAAPLLRAWLNRLAGMGCALHTRSRWLDWSEDGGLVFDGFQTAPPAVIFALGGFSWPRLGSDGGWAAVFARAGIPIVPPAPSNCGFNVEWSDHFRSRFAGAPVKSVGISFGGRRLKGEFVITEHGIEGGAVYALSAALRDEIAASGRAVLMLDLKPDTALDKLAAALAKPRGSRSISAHLDRCIGLKGVHAGLLRECAAPGELSDAATIKDLPLVLTAPRPISEAISSAGGVDFAALDDDLMLKSRPGAYVAGEMLDWEAPTGGYLLTACMAQGRAAGLAAAARLAG